MREIADSVKNASALILSQDLENLLLGEAFGNDRDWLAVVI